MELLIHVEGATEEDRKRGVAAAQRVFDRALASACDCAWSAFKRKAQRDADAGSEERCTEQLQRQARLWDQAERAGIQACCQRWGGVPSGSHLELRFGDAKRLHMPVEHDRHAACIAQWALR